jgi:hypothetical protein
MITVVILALLMVPVFFVAVQSVFSPRARAELRAAARVSGVRAAWSPGFGVPVFARAFLSAITLAVPATETLARPIDAPIPAPIQEPDPVKTELNESGRKK